MRKDKRHTRRLRKMWVVYGIRFGISGRFVSFGPKQSEVEIVKQRSASSIKIDRFFSSVDTSMGRSTVERTVASTIQDQSMCACNDAIGHLACISKRYH